MARPSGPAPGGSGPGEGGQAALPPGPPAFADRAEAGVLLGAALLRLLRPLPPARSERDQAGPGRLGRVADPGSARPCVLALPRGGVPVAAGIARALGAPLDVLVVRKIGHPATPELGLGAIAEDGQGGAAEPFFDPGMLAQVGLTRQDLAGGLAREQAELARRVALYTHRGAAAARARGGPAAGPGRTDLAGRLVVVADDGLATGVTARAALRSVRARGAAAVVLAVPVAAPGALRDLQKETDEVVTLVTPRRFSSVGEWYADFGQLTDADVLTLLAAIP
ncbi:MAG TPA: phosphoribosyltransferase family protein [Trebonia sp.]